MTTEREKQEGELLPCANCGSKAMLHRQESHDGEGGLYIECVNPLCMITTPLKFACMDDVVPLLTEIWNTRTEIDTLNRVLVEIHSSKDESINYEDVNQLPLRLRSHIPPDAKHGKTTLESDLSDAADEIDALRAKFEVIHAALGEHPDAEIDYHQYISEMRDDLRLFQKQLFDMSKELEQVKAHNEILKSKLAAHGLSEAFKKMSEAFKRNKP